MTSFAPPSVEAGAPCVRGSRGSIGQRATEPGAATLISSPLVREFITLCSVASISGWEEAASEESVIDVGEEYVPPR